MSQGTRRSVRNALKVESEVENAPPVMTEEELNSSYVVKEFDEENDEPIPDSYDDHCPDDEVDEFIAKFLIPASDSQDDEDDSGDEKPAKRAKIDRASDQTSASDTDEDDELRALQETINKATALLEARQAKLTQPLAKKGDVKAVVKAAKAAGKKDTKAVAKKDNKVAKKDTKAAGKKNAKASGGKNISWTEEVLKKALDKSVAHGQGFGTRHVLNKDKMEAVAEELRQEGYSKMTGPALQTKLRTIKNDYHGYEKVVTSLSGRKGVDAWHEDDKIKFLEDNEELASVFGADNIPIVPPFWNLMNAIVHPTADVNQDATDSVNTATQRAADARKRETYTATKKDNELDRIVKIAETFAKTSSQAFGFAPPAPAPASASATGSGSLVAFREALKALPMEDGVAERACMKVALRSNEERLCMINGVAILVTTSAAYRAKSLATDLGYLIQADICEWCDETQQLVLK